MQLIIMDRNIYRVDAWIIDSNGTFNVLSGYPKNFDSRTYNGDVDKTFKRAMGDFSEVFAPSFFSIELIRFAIS